MCIVRIHFDGQDGYASTAVFPSTTAADLIEFAVERRGGDHAAGTEFELVGPACTDGFSGSVVIPAEMLMEPLAKKGAEFCVRLVPEERKAVVEDPGREQHARVHLFEGSSEHSMVLLTDQTRACDVVERVSDRRELTGNYNLAVGAVGSGKISTLSADQVVLDSWEPQSYLVLIPAPEPLTAQMDALTVQSPQILDQAEAMDPEAQAKGLLAAKRTRNRQPSPARPRLALHKLQLTPQVAPSAEQQLRKEVEELRSQLQMARARIAQLEMLNLPQKAQEQEAVRWKAQCEWVELERDGYRRRVEELEGAMQAQQEKCSLQAEVAELEQIKQLQHCA